MNLEKSFPLILKRKNSFVNCLIILFIYLLPNFSFAQKTYFKHINVEDGLSHNTVFTIFQDSKGFMWFGTKDGLNRYDGHQFKIFKNEPDKPQSLRNNNVLFIYESFEKKLWLGTNDGISIYDPSTETFTDFLVTDQNGEPIWGQILKIKEDKSGNIWVASSSAGLYRFDPKTEKLTHYYHIADKSGSLGSGSVSSLSIDEKGVVWVGILGGSVQRFVPVNESFTQFDSPDQTLKKDLILDIFDHGNELLIGTKNGGLKSLDKETGKLKDVLAEDQENNSLFVRNIAKYDGQEVWVCTELGIYVYNATEKKYKHLVQNPNDPYSLSDNAVYSIYKDSEGGIWLGTYFGGINYLPNSPTTFEKYYPIINQNSIEGKRVREFVEDGKGNIWIGTEDAGLTKFRPEENTFTNYLPKKDKNSISYHNIHGLMLDKEELWISSHSQGLKLDILNLQDEEFKRLDQSNLQNPLFDSDIFSILKDSQGNKWFGTISGVYIIRAGQSTMEFFEPLSISFYYDILEDSKKNIWFATVNNGLFQYNSKTGETKHYMPDNKIKGSLPGISVISLFEDSKKRLWLGTEGYGLSLYNEKDDNFETFNTSDGLPSNTVYKILEDDLGYLWTSTGMGLARFSPENKKIESYTKSDGLLSEQFNYKSGLKSKNGTLYFGSLNGFIAFDPKTFTKTNKESKIVLTGLKLFNEEVQVNSPDKILQTSISETTSINLKHFQSSITISFAALGYTFTDSWKYVYKLDGLEKDWNYLRKNNEVSYLNIPPGSYTFRVKTVNDQGVFSTEETTLMIHVSPPFYFSNVALIVYFLLFLALAYILISSYRNKISKRHRDNIRKLESEKEKEIFHAKIEFFTNITHEIRTPLTLIKGPLEILVNSNEGFSDNTKENLRIMEKNANRLILLSNQLLDFRKAEKQSFQLNFVRTDISGIIEDLHYRFKPMAEKNQLNFTLTGVEKNFFADVDQEETTKILSNLISNALKYGDLQVSIHLDTNASDYFQVHVCNDGKLIDEAYQGKIFEPFYQIDPDETQKPRQGTGLGLPLAKSLSEMHGGELFFNPTFKIGVNCFTLKLPVKQAYSYQLEESEDAKIYEEVNLEDDSTADTINDTAKPSILLVEDNKELQSFIDTNLRNEYQIYKASNGIEALQVLDSLMVDLIISDIMMPLMDGIELCKQLKSNLAYSHLPIILLTAKSNMNSKIEGLEVGADVYLEKPFSLEYLILQIKNLLKYRDQVRKSFANSPGVLAISIAHTKADEEFLDSVNFFINENISNEQFGVNELAEKVNMSQSSLLRKIKGISKLTPNEYIRLVRLKHAAELLGTGKYSISEVCSMIGFNSPSYFSKCFQKQFGELPKDYQKN
ncbi:response regulator [Belliella sp. DSM 107340]|uniref:histidine kinase n=1 Tax=Belliella calami TaxID=2923436 RepID=A0ABS9UK73_9BACT|nr:response regulator [Belliella calami]